MVEAIPPGADLKQLRLIAAACPATASIRRVKVSRASAKKAGWAAEPNSASSARPPPAMVQTTGVATAIVRRVAKP